MDTLPVTSSSLRGVRCLSTSSQPMGWEFDLEVLGASPYFAGHFVGEPVLPGVAQLAILVDLYTAVSGAPQALREAGLLRFRGKILPGDLLRVGIDRPDEMGRSRFWIQRSGATVSQGTVTWGD